MAPLVNRPSSQFTQSSCLRSVSSDGFIRYTQSGFYGAEKSNAPTQCTEKMCAAVDASGNPATCGTGASCSDASVGDGYNCTCDPVNYEPATTQNQEAGGGVFSARQSTTDPSSANHCVINFRLIGRINRPIGQKTQATCTEYNDCSTANQCGFGTCVNQPRQVLGTANFTCVCDGRYFAAPGEKACLKERSCRCERAGGWAGVPSRRASRFSSVLVESGETGTAGAHPPLRRSAALLRVCRRPTLTHVLLSSLVSCSLCWMGRCLSVCTCVCDALPWGGLDWPGAAETDALPRAAALCRSVTWPLVS